MQMAGLVPTPQEKAMLRYGRKMARVDREGKAQLLLVDMIQRREKGDEGLRPMPFAKDSNVTDVNEDGSSS